MVGEQGPIDLSILRIELAYVETECCWLLPSHNNSPSLAGSNLLSRGVSVTHVHASSWNPPSLGKLQTYGL
jgi:hypothetical protein